MASNTLDNIQVQGKEKFARVNFTWVDIDTWGRVTWGKFYQGISTQGKE